MKTVEELETELKQKEAELSEAIAKAQEGKVLSITTELTEEGFKYRCEAPTEAVIKHTVSTIEGAFRALNSEESTSDVTKILLLTAILSVIKAEEDD